MKTTKPSLSSILGDPLSAPTVASCVPTSGSYATVTRAVDERREEEQDLSHDAKEQVHAEVKKAAPSPSKKRQTNTELETRPARFSSSNAVITMHSADSLSKRGNSAFLAGWQSRPHVHNGLKLGSLSDEHSKARRESQDIASLPHFDLPWLIPILSFDNVSRSTTNRTNLASTTHHGRMDQILRLSRSMSSTVQDLSALLAIDLLHSLVQTSPPWISLKIHRAIRRSKRNEYAALLGDQIAIPLPQGVSMTSKERRSTPSYAFAPSANAPRGIRNYGQTCFLNSVLQALASLEPFLVYLDRVVQLHDEQVEYGNACNDCLSDRLQTLLRSLNQPSVSGCDPREILHQLSRKNKQFHGRVRGTVGREQQDAHELLQALLDFIIDDAHLTSSCSLESSFVPSSVADGSGEESDDCYLSLSELLLKMDLEQKAEPSKDELTKLGHGETGLRNVQGANLDHSREEKKQEEHDQGLQEELFYVDQHSLTPPTDAHMLQTLSSVTPSPLSGWTGSTVQCCTCGHVRPIRNEPFLHISLTPTALSQVGRLGALSHPPQCTIDECLREYVSAECVQDVECGMCTIQQEIAQLEDEVLMLRGAISTVLKRSRRKSETDVGEYHAEGLTMELKKAESTLEILRSTDPDEVDHEALRPDSLNGLGLCLEERSALRPLRRGPARRCEFLTRLPFVLCLHIQRKYFDSRRGCTAKTLQHVAFPEVLDVRPYCAYGGGSMVNEDRSSWAGSGSSLMTNRDFNIVSTPIPYKLQSVIEHRGDANLGHYQTYRRGGTPRTSEKWFLVSDTIVTRVTWREVRRCQAYMLFYESM